MTARYVLAPIAARDLVQIWRYIKKQSSVRIADRAEQVILDRILFHDRSPGAGHSRKDLTEKPVKFFPIYSYLIVYLPDTKPLQVVAILHGHQNVKRLLKKRL